MSVSAAPWSESERGLRIRVRVQPRSSRSRVTGVHAGALKVQVNSPPADGAANQELVRLLASWLGVAKSAVTIVRGRSGRDKLVEVASSSPQALGERLAGALAGSAAAVSVDNDTGAG